ncbi:hypothetical protein CAPTEDRAFT_214362 [Capitella teleta]|uniref:Glycosyltransferase family 92 protein n=1 Tax=Capitella teleta TaxID=283909 RepID=R7TMI1_CAPTE|nr:hypothetical protein CAPTEDRAFT_214362 [Capitella teleta]|eukprot:ELT92761.1 hypothetical protein CAPTEDRAFT_214362 [Capitella teleta]
MPDKSTIVLYVSVATILFSLVQIYNSGFNIHKQWKARISRPLVKSSRTESSELLIKSVYEIKSLDVYIVDAHFDCRSDCYVRLPALQPSSRDFALLCLFQSGGRQIQSQVTVDRIFPSWPPNSQFIAVLYSCRVPQNQKISFNSVKIVNQFHYGHGNAREGASKDSAILPLRSFQPSTKEDTVVCLKSTDGPLAPDLFLEWIEFYRLQGITRFYVYDGGIEKDNGISTYLDFYQTLGIVQLVQFPFSSKVMDAVSWNQPLDKAQVFAVKQQIQLISLNDCFYQFHNKANRMLLVDLDELLLPSRTSENLIQMFDRGFRDNSNHGNILFQNAWYFMDQQTGGKNFSGGIDSFFSLPPPLLRTAMSEKQPKGVFKTDAVLTINWHCAIHVLNSVDLDPYVIISPIDYGLLHHFRKACEDKFMRRTCSKMSARLVEDSAVFAHESSVKEKVEFIKERIRNVR